MAKKQAQVKKESAPKGLSEEDRRALNDRARYDYGIMNASDMSEKQLKDEIAVIDKQATDAAEEDEKARKESVKSGEAQNKLDDAGKN